MCQVYILLSSFTDNKTPIIRIPIDQTPDVGTDSSICVI